MISMKAAIIAKLRVCQDVVQKIIWKLIIIAKMFAVVIAGKTIC